MNHALSTGEQDSLRPLPAPARCLGALHWRALIHILLLCGLLSLVSAASPHFGQMYDYYFPEREGYLNTTYRKWFDQLLTARGEPSRHHLRDAMRGDREGFNAFVHHRDRNASGEFGLTWNYECLFLLLYLGDEKFANLLAREDTETREAVGRALEQGVDWTKHSFAKTAGLYRYRSRRPTADKIESLRHRTHFVAVVTLRPTSSDRLKVAIAKDNRFSAVEVWLTSFNGDNAVITAPRSLSRGEMAALEKIVQDYAPNSKVTFR